MQHPHLVEKFNRGQRHYKKGNYLRAKWLFEKIVNELSSSDTDSMADISLHNDAVDYLDKISAENLLPIKFLTFITIILILSIIIYLVIK